MRKSIITDIFNGKKGNHETMELSKKLKDNLSEVADGYEKLKSRFNPEQMSFIEEFLDVYDNNSYDEIEYYFTQGFKLGLLIGVECFEDNL